MTDDMERTVIAGRNPVREALERGDARLEKVLIQQGREGEDVSAIRSAASEADVPVQYVPAARLDHEAGRAEHQGVLAWSAALGYRDPDDLLAEIAPTRDDVKAQKPLLVLLDRITDPQNYGAILRSAVALGAAGVIVPQRHMAPLSAATVKASAGTAPRIPIARTGDLTRLIAQLKERAYWMAGADGDGEETIWSMDWDRPTALVIGSEGKGLRPHVAEACDHRVRIPLHGPAESLNASVAAGILLAAAGRERVRG
jgi:23S rRNA (guanosine2251-2'-O)-methyltransferase